MSRYLIRAFAAILLLVGCGNNKQDNNMPITINLRYSGVNGNALKFAQEMLSSGTVDAHHATPMMATIAALREKYDLHMTVERYTGADMPETDNQFIRH